MLENKAFQLDISFFEATETPTFRIYSFQGNIRFYTKHTINALFGD